MKVNPDRKTVSMSKEELLKLVDDAVEAYLRGLENPNPDKFKIVIDEIREKYGIELTRPVRQ